MGQFSQFVINHWELWLALVVIVLLLFAQEWFDQHKRAKSITPGEAVYLMNHDDTPIFDLRDKEAYKAGHIIDAKRASLEDFTAGKLAPLKDTPFIVVCARGTESNTMAGKLKQQGFTKPMVLAGGMSAWLSAKLPVVKGNKNNN